MGESSKIEWTDATVNFWWGCTKVGLGCDHCYAETFDKRVGGAHWGLGAPRRKIKSALGLIEKLHKASDPSKPTRVFVQSMSDLFDLEVELDWFNEAWYHIEMSDRLAVQIVTKRISVVEKRLAAIGAKTWPRHAGLMVTVVNQLEADRDVPRLLELKAKFDIPWVGLSIEPLLGAVDLEYCRSPYEHHVGWSGTYSPLNGSWWPAVGNPEEEYRGREEGLAKLDWIIVGGESGPGARPMHPGWARSIRDQCAAAGVPFFYKQTGAWAPMPDSYADARYSLPLRVWVDGAWTDCGGAEGEWLARVGKKAAGRLLDGIEHNAMPAPRP